MIVEICKVSFFTFGTSGPGIQMIFLNPIATAEKDLIQFAPLIDLIGWFLIGKSCMVRKFLTLHGQQGSFHN